MMLYIIIGVTVVALIVLVTIFLLQKRKAKKAAEAMGDQGAAPGGDDISVLIHEAEAKLAAAKLENAKVGALPVYLIVGEPGTTKTSVMLHSGLEPELIAGQAYQAGNVASTRTANFWFSRRSLFVETGGALSNDLGKWRAAVKKLQPRSSVRKGEQAGRAAVVCFDCENFTKPGAADIVTNSGRNLRARLGEISQAMGINLPVYVLFTKVDRLPFFTEFVRNLNGDEHTQVLGVTLPMMYRRSEGVYAEEETARLTGSFERLFRSVADARPEFLAREGDASKLPPAYEFPREFRKIRPAVVQFLVDLCRPSQLTVGPFLRGFYFTGVRPVIVNESAPVAPSATPQASGGGFPGPAGATAIFNPRMLQAQAAAAPVQPAAPAPVVGGRKVPQWLFLSHLFNDILLADKVAMGASGSSIKTSTARRILLAATASLCFLLAVIFTISFFKNNSLENRVREAARVTASADVTGGELASLDALRKLETLRESLETLVEYRRDGAPWGYRFGLYIGNDLYKVARPIYCGRFRKLLLTQTQANILQDMRSLPGATAPDVHPYQPTYDELKAYLITTTHPDKSTRTFLTPVLMRWWTNRREIDSERVQLAQKQFDFYADDLKQDGPCIAEGDSLAVDRTRKYLKLFGGFEQVYGAMLAEADKHGTPINFNRQFPGSAQYVVDNYDVRAAFSKGGWQFMNENFGKADPFLAGEQWVLGDVGGPSLDRGRIAADLKARYYGDFIKEWTNYVKTARVVGYTSLRDAAQKLKAHAANVAPLLEFSSLASRNTAVQDPAQSGPFQPTQWVTPADKTDTYVGPSNQSYINALVQLQSSVEAIANQPPNDNAAASTLQVAQQAKGTVSQIAQGFHIDSPIQQTLQNLLLEPITNAERLLKGVGVAELNANGGKLCNAFKGLLQKYPFNLGSPTDATVADVNGVFRKPDGALWAFYDQNLQKLLVKQGSQYVPASSTGTVTLNPAFVNWFNTSANFGEAIYANGAQEPRFTYKLTPQPTDVVQGETIHIDGQTLTYTAGGPATAQQFVWQGGGQHGTTAAVKFGGPELTWQDQQGLWSVFRFFNDAERWQPSAAGQTLEWVVRVGRGNPATVNGKPVTVRLELDMGTTPPFFSKGYFSRFGCVVPVAR